MPPKVRVSLLERAGYTTAMSVRWLALYTGEDPHPRMFDSLERALAYLERFERLPEDVLDTFALKLMGLGEATVAQPEVRQGYHLIYTDIQRQNRQDAALEGRTVTEAVDGELPAARG